MSVSSHPPSSFGMKRGSSMNVAALGIPETVHEQVQSTLRIGDTILLFSQEGQGFVYSDVSSKAIQSIVVHPVGINYQWTEPHFLPNIHCACYRVLAANKYKAQNRLEELKERIRQMKLKVDRHLKEQLKNAERNAVAEIADNELDQKRLEGQEVLYGSMLQLQHVYTGKYLSVNSSATSLLESTNLRTELTSQNSPNCMFKILPRYKVRSVGDEVRTYDQVMFESVKTEGQFLHCSVRVFDHLELHLHSQCKELNLSASESAFTVCLHNRPLPETKMDLLTAGGTIRLFHREIESYLVAEGSFAEVPENQITENVHLRKRKSDHGKLKPPSTSAITYWTIEKKKEPLSGEPILWYERCRIKHLLTQQYLAVERRDGQCVLTLKEGKAVPEFDQDTTFRLFPVITGEDEIKYGTYARINHPQTRTWLHASKGIAYMRKSFDPSATGLQGLRWDDAELFEASASPVMAYDDAFTLMEVEDKLVQNFNLVAGYVPVLKEYMEDRACHRDLTSKKAERTAKALGELSEFMLDAYARQKDHQKLVRNLRILEQLVEFLKLYKAEAKDAALQRKVCKACYRIIEVFLQGDSRKNELYVSRFVPFFEGQMRLGLNAEDMLIELVRDNPNIVSRFSEEQIDRIVAHILEMKKQEEEKDCKMLDCRMLDYLGVACVCEDKAAVPSQNYIVNQLLRKHGHALFFVTEVDVDATHPDGPRQVFYKDKGGLGRSLAEIAHKSTDRDEKKCTSNYRWLESQLDLFGKLAKGNNALAIKAITEEMKFITFEEALVGANDPELHPSIRSKYVELVRVLFVDVGNNRAVLDSLPNSFVYKDVKENPFEATEGDAAVALTGEENEHFDEMREWILKIVKTNTGVVCADSHIGENFLLAQILGVLELLVKYGYYDDPEDIKALLEPLLSMLNGTNDVPGVNESAAAVKAFQELGRFQDTLANRAAFEVKKKIMEVCDLFFNYRFYLRLQRFTYDYRCLKGDVEHGGAVNGREGEITIDVEDRAASPASVSSYEDQQRERGRRLRLPVALTVNQCTPPGDLKFLEIADLRVHEDEWLMKVARERMKHIFKPTAFFEGTDSDPRKHEFVKTLLDIAGYEDNELVVLALHLLNRYFSMESDLFEKATESQLLTTAKSIEIQDLVEKRVAKFRQICLHDLDVPHMRELELILEQLTKLCLLDEVLEEPHQQNQKILYNHGVLSDVLNLIFDRLDSRAEASKLDESADATEGEATADAEEGEESEDAVLERLFARCFQFLVALARGNRVVKEHLFNRMNSLLAIGLAVPDMAKLLFEVFSNFQEVCLRVEESQIEEVFRIITRVNGAAQAELLQMLRALTNTKVNEIYLPLKRNQAFIIKFYSKNREHFERVLGQEEGRKERRLDLLVDGKDDDEHLLLLLNITDVLASCCEGTNPFIESICQTIFSVEELLEYLCNDDITPERKRPFCRFLVWVYLSTNSEAAVQLNLYSTNEKMITFLAQCTQIVSGLVDVLSSVPSHNRASVRRQLKRSRSDSSPPRKRRATQRERVKSSARDVLRVTSATGELSPGILPYFMDGMLPLLKIFYQQFLVVHRRTDDDSMLHLMGEVAGGLMTLVEAIGPFLSNSDQAVQLRDCILQLTSSPIIDKYLVVSAKVQQKCQGFVLDATGTKSEAMKKYERNYKAEVKLNADFNAYVRGYELAYNGPNTIRHQLGLRGGEFLDDDYSEFLDTDMSVRGDEYLPLGPSFQGFVSCFVNREGSQPKVLCCTRHLIRLLDISFNHLEVQTEAERVRQDLLDAKCLQLLRAMIHNEIKRIDPELKENEPEKYRRLAANIECVQNTIQELGDNPIASIVPMLAHHNDITAAEVLAFLSVFLYDGNETVQAGFAFLTQTREERFFINIRKRLDHAVAIDTERRALVSQLQTKQADNEKLLRAYKTRTGMHRKSRGASVTAETTFMIGGETQRSTDVLAAVPEAEEEGEAFEMEAYGEEEDELESPTLDKSTAALLKDATIRRGTMPSPTESVVGKDPDRWVLSDIYRQKVQEVQADLAEEAEKAAAESKRSKGADSDELRFQDSTYVELALRVLGLMCDGQNRTLQNYLREQPDNINNVNLVAEVALFLQHFYSDINKDNIELVNRIMQTLVELCVGNYYNQDVIFDRQIVDIVNRILQTSVFPGCKIADAMQLKASAVELLEVMLEDTHKKTPELAKNVEKALDIAATFRTMVYFYRLRDDPYLKSQQKDDDAERAMFRVFHVLRHLGDFEGVSREKVEATKVKLKHGATKEEQESAQDIWDAWKYCVDRSKSVEVLYENLDGEKILSRLHFHYQPDDELPEEIIEKVKWSVNRDSAEDKVRDYLSWMKAVKREVIHVNKLRERWFTHMFIYKAQYQHWALVFLTLLLNVLVLISWKGPASLGLSLAFEPRTVQLNSVNNVTNLAEQTAQRLPTIPLVEVWFGFFALFILGAVHLVMTIMQVIAHFLVNWPNFYYIPEFVYSIRGKERPNSSYSDVPFFGLRTLYYLVFLSCSILSICFWGYFYSICLLHIVVNNDLLQRVLRSVTKNGKSLLWVAALISVVLYIYAVLAYAGYQIYFEDPDNGSHCKTLFECVVSVFRLGLLNGALTTNTGGIFREGNEDLIANFGLYIPRTLFDLTFFIIVTTVGLNIVFGIIVDTFSELRDERYQTEADKRGFCFICHIAAYEFERRADGFDHHTKHEHNMWDYIYLCLELDRIDSSDQNAIQQFVYQQIEDDSTSFFPTLRARCLKEEEDTTKEEIAELKDMMLKILDKLKEKRTPGLDQDEDDHSSNWETSSVRDEVGTPTAADV